MPRSLSAHLARLAAPLGLLAASLALAACRAGVPPAAAPLPDLPRHGIVFAGHSSDARTDYDLYRVCADGSQLAALVIAPGSQYQLAVSPDGTRLAYTTPADTADDASPRDIVVRPLPSGSDTGLVVHPAADGEPAFSPDGSRLAFQSTRDARRPDLYVLNLASGAIDRVTTDSLYDAGAEWLPDGSGLLFTRYIPESGDTEGHGEIVHLDLATGDETWLTDLGGYNGGIDISPDGRTVAFHRAADGGSEIWTMRPDGSDARPLTDTFVDEYSPQFSPDGHWILVSVGTEHDGRGTFDLALIRADGSDRRLVTRGAGTEAWAQWRPGTAYCR